MMTPVETLRANMAHLDTMARVYADALVAYHQAGDDNDSAYAAMIDAHAALNKAAEVVANTL